MKVVQRTIALRAGLLATVAVFALQIFNGVACYHLTIGFHLAALGLVCVAFLPGLVTLLSQNPLRAVGAALAFAPWLGYAFYTDCVLPPKGPASSMSYLAVVVYGFLTSAVGAWVTGPLLAALKVRVGDP